MPSHPILNVQPLGFPWATVDPFLFCAHHDDAYPSGNPELGPAGPLAGRDIGQDFSRKDGWSMYHGSTVPGFPAHPHRGFETVTIVRQGLIDHSDSLGAAARFGRGDVQWLTAGAGVVHSEMFPLLNASEPNPLELFQIWLNLPAGSKMVKPHFTMLWSQQIPRAVVADSEGRETQIAVIAGRLADVDPPPTPPPDSWAAVAGSDVAIWTLRMAPGARFTLPAAVGKGTRRTLYFFSGASVDLAGQAIASQQAIEVEAGVELPIFNSTEVAEFLMLQGRPIGEPVVQYGPFVMNTQAQIMQAVQDYRRTGFGGWPWPDEAPQHGPDAARFARHPDGRQESPDTSNLRTGAGKPS